jgi:hypothetical protein
VDGIASKITEEIGMFFEDLNIDTGTGKQETQNHASRSAADYTASGLDGLGIWIVRGHSENSSGCLMYCKPSSSLPATFASNRKRTGKDRSSTLILPQVRF